MFRLVCVALMVCGAAVLADEKQGKADKVALSADLGKLLKLVNEARAKEKLAPLAIDAALCKVAAGHSENMAKQQKMEHELEGKKVEHRATAAGYDYRFVGENIASGDPKKETITPEKIHKGLMDSKSHRAAILDREYTRIGLAVAKGKDGISYYTQVFARPVEADLDKVLELINKERAKQKLPALKRDAVLSQVAARHAAEMAKKDKKFGDVAARSAELRKAEYAYRKLSESFTDFEEDPKQPDSIPKPDDVFAQLIEVRANKDNILDKDFTHVGLGMARTKKGAYYYSLVFTRRADADLEVILQLLNDARAKEKLPALKLDATLSLVALAHCENMIKQGKLEHELDGKRSRQRMKDIGYAAERVGENLYWADTGKPASAPVNPAEVHKGWMDSPNHRKNMLDPDYTRVGLAMARSKKGEWYYTEVFATPK